MHTATQWYLDIAPDVYTKIEWSYQEAIEKAVKHELWIMLHDQKQKLEEDDK